MKFFGFAGIRFRKVPSFPSLSCFALTSLALCSLPVFAQTNQGAIAGNVQDVTGSVIGGARLTAVEENRHTTYETVSTGAGAYRFPNVNIGTYDITVTATGFKTETVHGVVVQVGSTSAVNVTLQVGAAQETVTVQGDAPTIQTETSDVFGVITSKQALDLPLNLNGSVVSAMRSPEAFVFLMPGTAGPGTANGNGGTFESKISGGQAYSTEVLLDGASIYRSENGSSFDETAPSVEAISTYKVELSTMPAELGRTTGGIESFSTTAGTNKFHGKVYDLFKNEALDANNWGNNLYLSYYKDDPAQRANYQRPLDKKNDYGGTLGGPVWIPKLYNGRDKTFFFFSWEQYRQTTGGISTDTIPTPAMLNGDFSAYLTTTPVGTNPCDGSTIYQGQIFDPRTTRLVGSNYCRTAFPGNKITNYALSSAAQSIINNLKSYYPAPQTSSLTNNYVYRWTFPILDTSMTVRVDQNLTPKQKMYFTYNSRDNTRLSTNPWLPSVAGAGRNQDFFTHYLRFGYDYAFTATQLNHFNLGYNRTNSGNYGAGIRYGGNWDSKLGISNGGGRTFPAIVVGGYTGFGDNVDGDTIDNGYRLNDTYTWIHGRHEIKFGLDYRYQIYFPLSHAGESGELDFDSYTTSATNGTVATTGNGLASLLTGQVGYATLTSYANQPKWLAHYYALFIQDNFKITPTLTLNYGLRWDVDVPRRERDDNTSNIDLSAPNPAAGNLPGVLVFAGKGQGRTGVTGETWVKPWHKDFGPRVGFAWSPKAMDNKMVVRGGAGIIYAAMIYADFGTDLRTGFQANPGFFSPNGFDPSFTLDASPGFPAYTKPPNLDGTQLNFNGPTYISPNFNRPGMVENWSLGVQHQLATDLIWDMTYVGQHSTHLRSTFDCWNCLPEKYFALGNTLSAPITSAAAQQAGVHLPYSTFPTSQTVAQALRPYPQYFGFNTDCCLENLGQSSYHALETSLQRRFHDGLNLLASYTWSKTLTDADDALPYFSNLHGGGVIQNPFNKKTEKAISNQDTPQTFVLSYLYELPFGKGKKFLSKGGVVDKVVGGWQIGGVQRYQSGQPISFYCATGIPGFDNCIRYSRVQGQPLASNWVRNGHFDVAKQAIFSNDVYNPATNPNPYRYFNYGAMYDPNSASLVNSRGYVFGDMPRTTSEIRSFRYLDEDFSIIKRIPITEGLTFRFEADMIDAFNRHIFNRPNTDGPNDYYTFGFVSPTSMVNGPRNVQFLMKIEF
ncbi:carboxypeptidase regulatory-like domain-containing protein [Pseudacidobacterium ailaaui]|jgi:hypothetical protein|uniref:carboxypeptidase regulatory-like domain-containing protein n=1 Tax=Pseudacidobacterium ailaaui TaxID=1382359 RepID=UPI00047DA801|nr:TonB-dependent receptor [Pseudacidobacterium ailaaui]